MTRKIYALFHYQYLHNDTLKPATTTLIFIYLGAQYLCQSSWTERDQRCYYFSLTSRSGTSAQSWCQGVGGHLATVDSSTLNNWLDGETSSNHYIGLYNNGGSGFLWATKCMYFLLLFPYQPDQVAVHLGRSFGANCVFITLNNL